MSQVIQFLESMGSDPAASRLTGARYAALLEQLDVDADAREALRRRDPLALNALLGGRNKIYFALLPVDPEKPEEEPAKQEPTPEQAPTPPQQDRN